MIKPRHQQGNIKVLLLAYVVLLCLSFAVYWVQGSQQQEELLVQARQHVMVDFTALQQEIAPQLTSTQQQLQLMARTVGVIKENTAASGYYSNLRKAVQTLLHQQLVSNPSWRSTFSVWQSNGVDGQDEVFEGDEEYGSNQSGRFASRWRRNKQDELSNTVITEDELERAEMARRYFDCESRDACQYQTEVFNEGSNVRLTAPLIDKQKTVAIVGVDLSLEHIRASMKQWREKRTQGALALINDSVVVASVNDEKSSASLLAVFESGRWKKEALHFNSDGEEWFVQQVSLAPQAMWLVYRVPNQRLLEPLLELQQHRRWSFLFWQLLVAALLLCVVLMLNHRVERRNRLGLESIRQQLQVMGVDEQLFNKPAADVLLQVEQLLQSLQGDLTQQNEKVVQLMTLVEKSREISEQTCEAIDAQQQVLINLKESRVKVITQSDAINVAAESAAESARQATVATESACTTFTDVANKMQLMSNDVVEVGSVLQQLKEDSEKVVGIITVISSVAEQTNLLALNAAIESARAGEHGRGFAVVADEVRALAKRTQEATVEVHTMIDALVAHAEEAGSYSEKSLSSVELNAESVEQAKQELDGISNMVSSMAVMSKQVAAAALEQLEVSQLLSESVERVGRSVEVAESIYIQRESLREKATDLFRGN